MGPREIAFLVKMYAEFLDKTDPEKFSAIMQRILLKNQHETRDNLQIKIMDGFFESLVEDAQAFSTLTEKKTKAIALIQDYEKILDERLKEAKHNWSKIFLEKILSPENMQYFRGQFKKLIALQKSEDVEHTCQKCQSFIAELRRAEERSLRKKLSLQNSHVTTPIYTPKKLAVRAPGIDLIAKIMALEPAFEKAFLKTLSRPERENLIFVLENIGLETRKFFIGFPKLRKLIANNSDFMEAVRFNDQEEILSALGIKKSLKENTQDNQAILWKDYTFPENTRIKFISAATKNTTHVSKVLREINVRPIFLHASKIRLIEEVVRSNDMLVLVTGFIDHKIQKKLNSIGRDYVAINYIYSSNICQRLIEACLKKGIPLVRKN